MNEPRHLSVTAFSGQDFLASGRLSDVALAVKAETQARPDAAVLVFDNATGKVVDLDLCGSEADVVRRLEQQGMSSPHAGDAPKPGRGRPRLGVVAREVTLLPRHWDWLAAQPGGASQALRRLVDRARAPPPAPPPPPAGGAPPPSGGGGVGGAARPGGAPPAGRRGAHRPRPPAGGGAARRAATDAAYRFMAAMAGDLPGFEEASRALFAGDEARLTAETAGWPADIRDHALRMSRLGA